MRRFYQFYLQSANIEKSQQLVVQLPWVHHMLILDKIKSYDAAIKYLEMTIENSEEYGKVNPHVSIPQ